MDDSPDTITPTLVPKKIFGDSLRRVWRALTTKYVTYICAASLVEKKNRADIDTDKASSELTTTPSSSAQIYP